MLLRRLSARLGTWAAVMVNDRWQSQYGFGYFFGGHVIEAAVRTMETVVFAPRGAPGWFGGALVEEESLRRFLEQLKGLCGFGSMRDWTPEAGTDSTAVDLPKARADATADAPPGPAPLRGVRHENSVLFSLGNLAQLAGPAPGKASPAGRTEGSGLLDIQSLARSLAPVRDERSRAEVGELPVYGALPFAEPAVLIPSSPPRRDRRLIWALAATAGDDLPALAQEDGLGRPHGAQRPDRDRHLPSRVFRVPGRGDG